MVSGNSARIVHRSHGRLRVRVDRLRHDAELVHRVEERLSNLPGVRRIEMVPETGSVLVLFEPSRFDEERLASEAREAELFHLSLSPRATEDGPSAGVLPHVIWRRANTFVNQKSRSPLDLRTLFPLALVAWAVKQILTERPIPRTPWYTLLWYAFGLYTKFNLETEIRRATEPARSNDREQ
jgi:hypothetical protein